MIWIPDREIQAKPAPVCVHDEIGELLHVEGAGAQNEVVIRRIRHVPVEIEPDELDSFLILLTDDFTGLLQIHVVFFGIPADPQLEWANDANAQGRRIAQDAMRASPDDNGSSVRCDSPDDPDEGADVIDVRSFRTHQRAVDDVLDGCFGPFVHRIERRIQATAFLGDGLDDLPVPDGETGPFAQKHTELAASRPKLTRDGDDRPGAHRISRSRDTRLLIHPPPDFIFDDLLDCS